jgi:hypothetical protein
MTIRFERLVEHDGRVYRVETRITTHTIPSAEWTPQREHNYKTAERFMREHGDWPELGDGEAGKARRRLIEGSLRAHAQAPAQPFEPDGGRWRRRTARRQLLLLDRRDLDHVAERTAGREPRRPRGVRARPAAGSSNPQHRQSAPAPEVAPYQGYGEQEEGDVEYGRVVPDDMRLDDLGFALCGHEASPWKTRSSGGKTKDERERALWAGPVLADERLAPATKESAEHERDDDDVVELAREGACSAVARAGRGAGGHTARRSRG